MSTAAPSKQVITFKPDGTIEGLQFKSKGIDLRKFGRAKIERTSDIIFDEDSQKYSIKFLHGTIAGQTARLMHAKFFDCVPALEAMMGPFGDAEARTVLLFDEYDQAVAVEVLLIQSARVNGKGDTIAPI